MLYYPENVTSARQTLGNLWPLLKPGLWHSTPAERYGAILNNGKINPDGDQGGNIYSGSFVLSINAVSLFDFEKAKEDDALGTLNSKWSSHLKRTDTRVNVWIGLNRNRLPGRLILADEGAKLACGIGLWYPRVEACHVGPVPTYAFTTMLAVSTADPRQFEPLVRGTEGLPRLRELTAKWPDPVSDTVRTLWAGRDRNARREQQVGVRQ